MKILYLVGATMDADRMWFRASKYPLEVHSLLLGFIYVGFGSVLTSVDDSTGAHMSSF